MPIDPSNLQALQKRLGYVFRDPELLKLSLTHPSVAHENPGAVQHNQRLEFLGDAVLSLVLTHELYSKFDKVSEGPLTKARAELVNRQTLAAPARSCRLGDHLILSHGEDSSGGRARSSTLADAYEALLGAIYLDGGLEAAREVILRSFRQAFGELKVIPSLKNPKGELQELLQEKSATPPEYHLTSISGPDHDRLFECAVFHEGKELGRGKGKTKKAAESEAALMALKAVAE